MDPRFPPTQYEDDFLTDLGWEHYDDYFEDYNWGYDPSGFEEEEEEE